MRLFILFFLSSLSLNAYSQNITFKHPCTDEVMANRQYTEGSESSLGSLSIKLLSDNQIAYQGNSTGINQILNTPIGLEALDVLSDNEMLAWGWCFSVDGIIPEVLADQVYLDVYSEVIWFFGYAHYLDGQWVSQCQREKYCR